MFKALRRRDAVAAAEAIGSDLADAADVIRVRDEFVLDEDLAVAPGPRGANDRAVKGRRVTKEEMR